MDEAEMIMNDPTNKPEIPREAPRSNFRGRFRDLKMTEDGKQVFVEWEDGFRIVISASWLRLQSERWIKR